MSAIVSFARPRLTHCGERGKMLGKQFNKLIRNYILSKPKLMCYNLVSRLTNFDKVVYTLCITLYCIAIRQRALTISLDKKPADRNSGFFALLAQLPTTPILPRNLWQIKHASSR